MKDGFIFYKSYEDAIACIKDDAERLRAYEALIKYALHGQKEDVDGYAGVVLNMAIPTIDANNRRYEKAKECGKYGVLGGRPRKTKAEEQPAEEEQPKQEETPEAKPKKASEPKKKYGQRGNVRLTEEEFEHLQADYGESLTNEAIDFFDSYMAEKPYKSKSHELAMRRWVFDAVKEKRAKQNQIQFASRARNFVNIPRSPDTEDMQALERQLLEN